MNEKSEAQIRNEEEVRRIMKERGYSSASSKKQVKKAFGNNFPFGSFIVGIISITTIAGGWILLQNYIFGNETDNDFLPEEIASAEYSEELIKFQDCLKKVDTSEIALDDSEFWNKHINQHEQAIACYEQYPSVASSSQKIELQNELNKLQESSESIEASDVQYRNRIAKINTNLAKNLAEIEAKNKESNEEFSQRTQERQAQREALDAKIAENNAKLAEYEAQQQAKKEAEEQAKQEKETRCMQYIGKTKEELADNDSDVKSAKNTYDLASSNYSSVYRSNAAAYSNAVRTKEQQEKANAKIAEAKSKMDIAQSNYNNIRNSKISYYSQILNSCK